MICKHNSHSMTASKSGPVRRWFRSNSRHPADGSFNGVRARLTALHHPFQDAHVVAVTRPEKFSLGGLAKPVHMKNSRQMFHQPAHFEPVRKIIAHVVTAK